MASLRTKLTIATAATTATVVVVLGLVIFLFVRSALRSEFDRVLDAKARGIAGLVELDGRILEIDFGDRLPSEFHAGDSPDYFEIWVKNGPVLARSPSLGTTSLAKSESPGEVPVFRDVSLPDKRTGRTVSLDFSPRSEPVDEDEEESEADEEPSTYSWRVDLGDGEHVEKGLEVTVVVGCATTEIDGTLLSLAWVILLATAAGVLLTALAQTWVVRQGFAPLSKIASHIDQIDEADLASRLPSNNAPIEMQPVINKLNGLLVRLDAAFERERSFSADVAHEMRTPLAGLLSTAEVTLSKRRSDSEYRASLRQTVKISKDLHGVVENLLALKRMEAGQVVPQREPLRLDDLLTKCWNSVSPRAETRGLEIVWDLQSKRVIESDRMNLMLILKNLFDNAADYTKADGRVYVSTADYERYVCLRITNPGSEVAAADSGRVFDRFWRGDTSREGTGQHSGLGLSIVRQLCDLLNISISANSVQGGNFSVELCFRRPLDTRSTNAIRREVGSQPVVSVGGSIPDSRSN